MDLPLEILDAAVFVTTFMQVAAATIAPTVASTCLNDRNFSKKLILHNLGYSGCEVVRRLQICNAINFRPDFKMMVIS